MAIAATVRINWTYLDYWKAAPSLPPWYYLHLPAASLRMLMPACHFGDPIICSIPPFPLPSSGSRRSGDALRLHTSLLQTTIHPKKLVLPFFRAPRSSWSYSVVFRGFLAYSNGFEVTQRHSCLRERFWNLVRGLAILSSQTGVTSSVCMMFVVVNICLFYFIFASPCRVCLWNWGHSPVMHKKRLRWHVSCLIFKAKIYGCQLRHQFLGFYSHHIYR